VAQAGRLDFGEVYGLVLVGRVKIKSDLFLPSLMTPNLLLEKRRRKNVLLRFYGRKSSLCFKVLLGILLHIVLRSRSGLRVVASFAVECLQPC